MKTLWQAPVLQCAAICLRLGVRKRQGHPAWGGKGANNDGRHLVANSVQSWAPWLLHARNAQGQLFSYRRIQVQAGPEHAL